MKFKLGGIIFPMLWMHKCYLMIKILSKKFLCFILQEYLYLQDRMIWTLYVLQCISNLIHVMCPRHCLIILLKICYAGYFSAYHTFTEFLLSPCFGFTNGTWAVFHLSYPNSIRCILSQKQVSVTNILKNRMYTDIAVLLTPEMTQEMEASHHPLLPILFFFLPVKFLRV